MSNKNESPKTDAEIAAWVEERRVAAQADYAELTETLKRMRQMAAHNYPSKEQLNGGKENAD